MTDGTIGKVSNVSVGRGTAGSFSIKDSQGVADGNICMSDAKDKVKCCPGDKPWILVCFALNPYEDQIDGYDKEYFHMLGFVFGTAVAQSVKTDERLFVHCCCEKGSLLSSPVNRRKVKIHEVTK